MKQFSMVQSERYTLINGDCVEEIKKLPDESIDFTVFSPPFPEMYCYSNDERDMGNSRDFDELMQHFSFLLPDQYRVTKQGRNVAIHCMDIPIQKGKHGYIGLRDYSGMIIAAMESAGFVYHSRITIWKNPVTEMQRTKALGLLHKQVKKDSTMSRVGIPDYVLIFRKDGERNNPVQCKISVDTWQQYASPVWMHDDDCADMEMLLPLVADKYEQLPLSIRNKYSIPVWMDINYSETLNAAIAREDEDEKHICPLQLPTIERLITLYTNENDLVLTNFLGIGSEAYQAVKMNRRAIGFELKKAYFDVACKNMQLLTKKMEQKTLFQIINTEA